ncbi:hypothetical protein NH340_JMT00302 [Sarcoptes scabiei]|nr:hypothetical protein NH340_JMT00302 [Sarcoptes scabiei]
MISFLVDEDDRDFDHKQNKEKRNKKLRTTIESKEPRFNCHTVIIRERNDNLRIRRRKNKFFTESSGETKFQPKKKKGNVFLDIIIIIITPITPFVGSMESNHVSVSKKK